VTADWGGLSGEEMGTTKRSSSERAKLGAMALVALSASVAALLLIGFVGAPASKPSELFMDPSETLQFSSGHRAVLSGRDFVPLGGGNKGTKMSATAQRELAGLYAAAGVKYSTVKPARQMELAELPAGQQPMVKAVSRQHKDIDMGSAKRLVAAAANKMDAYSLRVPNGPSAQRRTRIKHALGSTIAKYFAAQKA